MSAKLEASGGISWSRTRVPTILSIIAKVMFVFGQAGTVAMQFDVYALGMLAMVGVLAYPVWIVSYIVSLSQSTDAGSFEVSETELVVTYGANQSRIALARIRAALVIERESFGGALTSVDVELDNGDRVSLTLRDRGQAAAIVDALGFGPGGRRIRSTFAKPTRRLLHPVLGFLAYSGGFGVAGLLASWMLRGGGSSERFGIVLALAPLVSLAAYQVLKWLLRERAAIAGEDGVEVQRMFGSTFVPRREIEGVERSHGALVVQRRNGDRIRLGGLAPDPARLAAFGRFIEERSPPEATGEDRLALYGRSELSIADWRAQLERRMKQTDYRSTASTTDETLAVLRSAQATPDQRIGAALAARVAGVPPERIRVAAEASADDRVRIALEAVADDGSDEVIEKAMKRLSR